MTRLASIGARAIHQPVTTAIYNQLQADTDYVSVAGADLASAATIHITSEFHGITGVTTIQTITDDLGQAKGQTVELWIKAGPLTISNSLGNIRTISGNDRLYTTNEIVTFVYDGALWREIRPSNGPVLASGTKTSNVTTTGTTFAAGADLLASALPFTADGVSSYLLRVFARGWTNNLTTAASQLNINLDAGTDKGQIASMQPPVASIGQYLAAGGVIVAPAAGAHTVNARLWVNVASTGTVIGGAGGAGADVPILVTLERL